MLDASGNTVSLTYDAQFRLVAVTDAIGQVSTLTYAYPQDIYKITKITDPFGRFATFDYDLSGRLTKITDVIGIASQFAYQGASDFVEALTTPYGTTSFTKGESGTTAWLETLYPNGERDRVEFNQSTNLGIPQTVPTNQLPAGMKTRNDYLWYRNTYVWDRNAYASAYPDYTKARIYHWLHTADGASAAGILESVKEPLEGRVWYDYAGQSDPIFVGTSNKPTHIGRVLDDGSTQLYTFEYDNFGNLAKSIDPVGRTLSYTYAANGLDLLEVRQTRTGNELLSKTTYNAQGLPLTTKDAAGQASTYTYNSRGQILTHTNPKNETTSYSYDTNGYPLSVNGPLPGNGDAATLTYDAFGRMRTRSDENGYTQTHDYDALDRVTRITAPDGTFEEFTYTALDVTKSRDRAGRETLFEYDPLRQLKKQTDPLNRVTLYDWCRCGGLKSLTDPMGRTTTWRNDVQGRVIAKEYHDGSRISHAYENSTSRMRERTDEKSQATRYTYNRDNTLAAISYGNTAVATPPVAYAYDPNHSRLTSMTDGTGVTHYTYLPITSAASLGAGKLASSDGPLPNDTITYGYDELGRQVSTAIDGVASTRTHDAGGRVMNEVNALGTFNYAYDGVSSRRTSQTYPNGQTTEWAYGTNAQDQAVQRITNKKGATAISEFLYMRDVSAGRITSWSQQAGTQTASVHTFGYDASDQLLSAAVASGGPPNNFGYTYDPAGNRLTETIDGSTNPANYNSLNQLTSREGTTSSATNEWDGEQRLAAVNDGNSRTEFTYNGHGRIVRLRKLVNGSEVSHRTLLWCEDAICQERDAVGAVTKRFFPQGVKVESGPAAGAYFYTRDHLESIRELTDSTGTVRARYQYDPFGRRTEITGDLDADVGYAGMFWSAEANLNLTAYRPYDPALARWLSRDPLLDAERIEGPNLYAYVRNNPINLRDPLGLCCESEAASVVTLRGAVVACINRNRTDPGPTGFDGAFHGPCAALVIAESEAIKALAACLAKGCQPPPPPPAPPPPPPPPPAPPPPAAPSCFCVGRICIRSPF